MNTARYIVVAALIVGLVLGAGVGYLSIPPVTKTVTETLTTTKTEFVTLTQTVVTVKEKTKTITKMKTVTFTVHLNRVFIYQTVSGTVWFITVSAEPPTGAFRLPSGTQRSPIYLLVLLRL